ncbi:methyltransferase [Flexivirga endophytica]|uniref:Methyltransferase n=1 Tax=Flexivirga endophytica TaxID=1849103 RepID=A0A916WSK3_9MICO|nr:class I SAM-dependent methyltransferase [Flexivirga endophytica]GGB26690.1 methyltransferase [Flexivirga endophytica]GHB55176.1 methyltransferase [Flexivirga endophytica]
MPNTAPLADDPAALRRALIAARFTLDGITECLGPVAAQALHREQRLPADLATRDDASPVATLVRLFALGLPVGVRQLDRALPGWDTARLRAAGMVSVDGSRVRAAYDLRPYGDDDHQWWVVSDLSEVMTGEPLPVDHVLGIGGASTTLASWTPRRRVARALDLGTGCGVQALHLTGHAEHIVATDTSARALEIASWNAALNGCDWDLRRGSLFRPVGGETFDLIVSNPPFVITPRAEGVPTYEYRDGGKVGDGIVRSLIRELPNRLNPGGVAQLLANWEVPEGKDWRDVVGAWFDRTGLDAWVVQRDTQDPAEYAELWSGDGGLRSGAEGFEQLYAAWLRDFEQRGIAEVGFGVVTVQLPERRRRPWRELIEVTGPVQSPMGPAIDAGLRARTWLAEAGEQGLLDSHLTVAADVTEERHGRPGAEDPSVIVIRQGGGLRRAFKVDTAMAAFVSVCDGELSTGQALAAIASLLEVPDDELVRGALPVIRDLVADGLLTTNKEN